MTNNFSKHLLSKLTVLPLTTVNKAASVIATPHHYSYQRSNTGALNHRNSQILHPKRSSENLMN
jgi:hypothetical protein